MDFLNFWMVKVQLQVQLNQNAAPVMLLLLMLLLQVLQLPKLKPRDISWTFTKKVNANLTIS